MAEMDNVQKKIISNRIEENKRRQTVFTLKDLVDKSSKYPQRILALDEISLNNRRIYVHHQEVIKMTTSTKMIFFIDGQDPLICYKLP